MILIIAGSKSDEQIVNKVKNVFDENSIEYEIQYASAHREPDRVAELAKKDYDVFIAIAGLSAALPGVVASHTKTCYRCTSFFQIRRIRCTLLYCSDAQRSSSGMCRYR